MAGLVKEWVNTSRLLTLPTAMAFLSEKAEERKHGGILARPAPCDLRQFFRGNRSPIPPTPEVRGRCLRCSHGNPARRTLVGPFYIYTPSTPLSDILLVWLFRENIQSMVLACREAISCPFLFFSRELSVEGCDILGQRGLFPGWG